MEAVEQWRHQWKHVKNAGSRGPSLTRTSAPDTARFVNPTSDYTRGIVDALGDASPALNVGAGRGNYEPSDRPVVALEPSEVMARQRPLGSGPVVRGVAEPDSPLRMIPLAPFSPRSPCITGVTS